MEVRDREFYDLIARGLENNGISFQDYIDEMFAEKYNKPETPGFDWEPDMQDDLSLSKSPQPLVYIRWQRMLISIHRVPLSIPKALSLVVTRCLV